MGPDSHKAYQLKRMRGTMVVRIIFKWKSNHFLLEEVG
jgi:hypothetical protein